MYAQRTLPMNKFIFLSSKENGKSWFRRGWAHKWWGCPNWKLCFVKNVPVISQRHVLNSGSGELWRPWPKSGMIVDLQNHSIFGVLQFRSQDVQGPNRITSDWCQANVCVSWDENFWMLASSVGFEQLGGVPKMGVSLNHPYLTKTFPLKPWILGYFHVWNPCVESMCGWPAIYFSWTRMLPAVGFKTLESSRHSLCCLDHPKHIGQVE